MTAPMSTISFAPAPAAAPRTRMLAAQTGMEFRLLMRNGEQVGLTLLIPLLLLFFFNLPLLYSLGTPRRIDFVVPSIITLAVMSAAFTGLAIGTGFERKYAVLKRLGATALPRSTLVLGKTLSVLLLEVVQVALICGLGLALARHPHGDELLVVVLVVLGTIAFGGLGLLVAGTLRAEVTLAAALPIGSLAIEKEPGRYVVTGEVTPQLLAQVTAWLASQNVLPDQLAIERRTLEDVFLDLTGRELRT
jgi:ABC-2 type transport system permease protein